MKAFSAKPWAKLARLSWRERARLGEALLYLAAAQLALVVIPFHRLTPHLGAPHAQSPETFAAPIQRAQAARIRRAVQTMSRLVPWDSVCLAQALAAKWMLARRGMASTLYLGVAYDEQRKLRAHAWLRCGNLWVTGAPQHKKFTIVETFAPRAKV